MFFSRLWLMGVLAVSTSVSVHAAAVSRVDKDGFMVRGFSPAIQVVFTDEMIGLLKESLNAESFARVLRESAVGLDDLVAMGKYVIDVETNLMMDGKRRTRYSPLPAMLGSHDTYSRAFDYVKSRLWSRIHRGSPLLDGVESRFERMLRERLEPYLQRAKKKSEEHEAKVDEDLDGALFDESISPHVTSPHVTSPREQRFGTGRTSPVRSSPMRSKSGVPVRAVRLADIDDLIFNLDDE